MCRPSSLIAVLTLALLSAQAVAAEFTTEFFRLTLPGAWRDVSEPDVIAYESSTGSQQVVVGEYVVKKALQPSELRSLLEQFVEMRRSAELELFRGRAVIGRVFYTSTKEHIRAEYWGEHAPTGHQFVTVVFATESRLQSFRYEFRGASAAEFQSTAESVISGMQLLSGTR
jgi:hypothetical protein